MPKPIIVLILFSLAVLAVAIVASPHRPPQPPEPATYAVVVLDAGHGAHDPGAVVSKVQEKDVNLALALRVLHKAQAVSGLRVILTRSSDTYPTLGERLKLAEAVGARLYVSIHANYFRDPRVCGVETWVDTNADPESLRLAAAMQQAVVAATGASDRGVRRQSLYLRSAKVPAALVEVGYLSCPVERTKLLDRAYQDKIADGILKGVVSFLGL